MRSTEYFAKFCSDAHGLLLRVALVNAPMVYDALTVFTKDKPLPMNVEAFLARRRNLRDAASHINLEAENFKLCNHKNPDGTDARYPSGSNGELACACGNCWD